MSETNPFPGMNPFMETRWRDVHLKMIALICEELGGEMPAAYSAMAEEHIEVSGGSSQNYYPDITIMDESWRRGLPPVWQPEKIGQIAVAEPEIVEVDAPPERWVEVRHDDGRLVTVIEIISPTNRLAGRGAFLAKRKDYINTGVNVVEIDLLREGQWLVDLERKFYDRRFGTAEHYNALTIRAGLPTRREIYICPLRQRLPVIRIPLRYPDPDVPLDLQRLIDHIYKTGRYWKLNYTEPASPGFNAEDQAWVNEQVKTAGLI